MIARMIEWWQRRRIARRIRRGRAEFREVGDLAAYYEDQVNSLNVEIDVQHTALQALCWQRDTMIVRRDTYVATVAQLEAQYRSA